jgi:hypothetical protein
MRKVFMMLINMRKLPPPEFATLKPVCNNNNHILLKAMDFRWKLPYIF